MTSNEETAIALSVLGRSAREAAKRVSSTRLGLFALAFGQKRHLPKQYRRMLERAHKEQEKYIRHTVRQLQREGVLT